MDRINDIVVAYSGEAPLSVEAIPQSGGTRRYYRTNTVRGNVIVALGDDRNENEDFISLSEHLGRNGIPVPQILYVSEDRMSYVMTDLGYNTLYEVLASGREGLGYSLGQKALLTQAVRWLARIQFSCRDGLQTRWKFDRRSIFFDLNYFKYNYLKLSGAGFDEQLLEDEFENLCAELLSEGPQGLMYRDFQARNIIVNDGDLYFVDYQGARPGPVHYDLVSFLWQAKAGYGDGLRKELIGEYLAEAGKFQEVDSRSFMERLPVFVLFRTLQVLGAYGFRGLVQGKSHFVESIPFALRNIRSVFADNCGLALRYPLLSSLLCGLAGKEPALHVEVLSFSYKAGLPADSGGNGGGYVFDCRAVNNPGRYPEYASLTGEDAPVREFLEKDGTVFPFLKSAFELADMQVKEYIRRDFTNLQIAFGCTGGRHRSVYCAEKMAVHLRDRFGVKVTLIHREQGRRYEL